MKHISKFVETESEGSKKKTMFLPLIFVVVIAVSSVNGKGCSVDEDCECGISKNIEYYEGFNNNQNKILGGKNSKPQDWPFIVELSMGCTGTIINNQWILSAAHCVIEDDEDNERDDVQRRFKSYADNGEDETYDNVTVLINGKWHKTELVLPHEDYLNGSYIDDIMLLKLKEPIQFNQNVSSICMHKDLTVPTEEIAAVAGFGERFIRVKTLNDTFQQEMLDPDSEIIFESSGMLRESPVIIRDLDYCKIPLEGINDKQSERVICAGGAGRGTTRGDSGGPLLVIRDHRWVQYGVTAYGDYSPIAGDLLSLADHGVYAKLSAHCDWIAEKTSNEVTCQ